MASTNSGETPPSSLGAVGNADQDHHPQLPTQQPTPPHEGACASQPDPRGLVVPGHTWAGVPRFDPPQILSEAQRPASEFIDILTAPLFITDDDDSDEDNADDPDKAPLPICSNDVLVKTLCPAVDSEQLRNTSDSGEKGKTFMTDLLCERRQHSIDSHVPVDFLFSEVKKALAAPVGSPEFDPEVRSALQCEFGEMLQTDATARSLFVEKLNGYKYIELDSTGRLAQLEGTKEFLKSRWRGLIHLYGMLQRYISDDSTEMGAPFEQFFRLISMGVEQDKAAFLRAAHIRPEHWSRWGLLSLSVPDRIRAFYALKRYGERELNEPTGPDWGFDEWLQNIVATQRPLDCAQQFQKPAAIFDNGRVECPRRRTRKIGKWLHLIFKYLRDWHHITLKGAFTIFLVPEACLPKGNKGFTKSWGNQVAWVAILDTLEGDELFWVLAHELGHVAVITNGYPWILLADVPLNEEGFAELVAWQCFLAFKRHWRPEGDTVNLEDLTPTKELGPPFGQFLDGFDVVFQAYCELISQRNGCRPALLTLMPIPTHQQHFPCVDSVDDEEEVLCDDSSSVFGSECSITTEDLDDFDDGTYGAPLSWPIVSSSLVFVNNQSFFFVF